jgi:chemotaxis protein MotB
MNHDQPVIIIKKKGHGHAHHGGAWKVAFADFMTAMMAFFLVMWILGLNQETRKSIAAYFNDPAGMMKSKAGGASVISINKEGSGRRQSITNGKAALLKQKKEREGMEKAKKEIENKVSESPKLSQYRKNIEVSLTRDGLRIELLEDKQALFFESGSSALRQNTVELLGLIGPVLAKLPNPISIEGHTDAHPYGNGTSGYTNWDLSADRANAARKALEHKLAPDQLHGINGYAATRLRKPEDPYHFSNRRISILVQSSAYREGVPTQQADEQGLIGLKPSGPDLEGEFLQQMRGEAKASH